MESACGMSKISREEKKERKKRVASESHAIKKAPKPKRILKVNKENVMSESDFLSVSDTSGNSAGGDADIRTLILSIKKAQCTKHDMKLFTDSVNNKLVAIESKVTSQDNKIESMNKRLSKCESQAVSAQYQTELEKQRLLKNNVSIFGIGRSDGENLLQIAITVFNKIGCAVADNQIANCYRINGNNVNIIIVKLTDYELKQKILKEKSKKAVTAGEIINCNSDAAGTIIYINNHVTPFFGKLLHEGRKAVKNGEMHSCWLNSFGCQMKMEENGKQHVYRSVDELKSLTSKKSTLKRTAPDDRSPTGNINKNAKS